MMAHHLNYPTYVSVDHLSSLVLSAGRGEFLVKADIKDDYRILPIHPHEHCHLDYTQPLKSFWQWLMPSSGSGINNILHYLDGRQVDKKLIINFMWPYIPYSGKFLKG